VTLDGIPWSSSLAFADIDRSSLFLAQELLKPVAAESQCQKEANREGWHATLHGNRSIGQCGLSTRVMIISKWSRSLLDFSDLTRHKFPERVILQCWFGLLRDGITAGLVYLPSGLKDGPANREILVSLAKYIRTLGKLCVLGGDWQMSFKLLAEPGFLKMSGATMVPCGAPTYKSAGVESESDFCVVSDALVYVVNQCYPMATTLISVALELETMCGDQNAQKVRTPPKLPLQIVCAPRVAPPDWSDFEQNMQ